MDGFCASLPLTGAPQATKPGQEPRDVLSWLLLAKYEADESASKGRLALEDDARLLISAGRYAKPTIRPSPVDISNIQSNESVIRVLQS